MLIGEYRCVMDEKSRINFPAKMREEMGDSFVVTRWLDNCLVAFPPEEWDRISALLNEKSMVKSRQLQRFLYSGAVEARPDKQGRILIPTPLREHAGLQKDVVVIGANRHVEIWDADAWRAATALLDSESAEAAMLELDI